MRWSSRTTRAHIKFDIIFLTFFILFPIFFIVASIESLVTNIIIVLLFLPFQIQAITLLLFHYDKQSERFSEERQNTVSIISRALKREGFNIRIIDYKNLIPRLAKYNSQIIIEEDVIDVRLYLKGIRLVSHSEASVKEIFSTHISIGPITPPKMEFILKFQSIIDNEMLYRENDLQQ